MNPLVKSLIEKELEAARKKFPEPSYTFTALTEEIGESARAILHYVAEGRTYHLMHVRHELIQTIVMAIRVLEEGDNSLGLPPSYL